MSRTRPRTALSRGATSTPPPSASSGRATSRGFPTSSFRTPPAAETAPTLRTTGALTRSPGGPSRLSCHQSPVRLRPFQATTARGSPASSRTHALPPLTRPPPLTLPADAPYHYKTNRSDGQPMTNTTQGEPTLTLTLTPTPTPTPTPILTRTLSPALTLTPALALSRRARLPRRRAAVGGDPARVLLRAQYPQAGLTRRPPSPEAAPHGRPCRSQGPGRFPSS